MTNKTRLLNNKAGFTLIELIVVMTILGILVLLGAPMYLGYTERANLTHIRHDVAVTEGKMEELLSEEDGYTLLHSWSEVDDDIVDDMTFYNKENMVDEVDLVNYRLIPDEYIDQEVRSQLNGYFYTNTDGFVLYSEHELSTTHPKNREQEVIETIGEYLEENYYTHIYSVWTAETPDEYHYIEFIDTSGYVPWSNLYMGEDGMVTEKGTERFHDGISSEGRYLYTPHYPPVNYYLFANRQAIDQFPPQDIPEAPLTFGDLDIKDEIWHQVMEESYMYASQYNYIPTEDSLGTLGPLFYNNSNFSYVLNKPRNKRIVIEAVSKHHYDYPYVDNEKIIMFPLNAGVGTDIFEWIVTEGPLLDTVSLKTVLQHINDHLDKIDIVTIGGQEYMVIVTPYRNGTGEMMDNIFRDVIFYNIFNQSNDIG